MSRDDAARAVENKRKNLRLAAMRLGAVANARGRKADTTELEQALEKASDELSSAKEDLRVVEFASAPSSEHQS